MFNLSHTMVALLLAMLSGVFMAIQGSLNSALTKVTGLLEATFIVHVTGTIAVSILLFGQHCYKGCNLSRLFDAPWYAYLGGIVGVLIIYLVIASIPKVGVANATTAIIVGQVLTAIAIDHFGAFGLQKVGFSWMQLLGLVLLAAGAKLLLKF